MKTKYDVGQKFKAEFVLEVSQINIGEKTDGSPEVNYSMFLRDGDGVNHYLYFDESFVDTFKEVTE